MQKHSFLSIFLTALISLLVVTSIVFAVTTISTNVTTDGNLTVSGSTTFNGVSYSWPSSLVASNFLTTDSSGNLSWGAVPDPGWTDSGAIINLSTSSDRVGIGYSDNASGAKLTVNGSVGIGTTNPLQIFQVNDTATAAFVVTSAGQVGIGTTNPSTALSIDGDLSFVGQQTISTTAGNLIFNPTTDVVFNDSKAAAFGSGSDSRIYYDGTDTFWNLRSAGTGDLMIALTGSFPSPDAGTVHIWSGDAGAVTAVAGTALAVETSTNNYLSLLHPANTTAGLLIGEPASNSRGWFVYDGSTHPTDTDRWRMAMASVDEYVFTATDLDMSNNTLSNVGAAENDITSAGYFAVDGSVTAPSFSFTSDTDTGLFRLQENVLSFGIGTTNVMSITGLGQNGRVGIGTTNPSTALSLIDNANLSLGTGGDSRLYYDGTDTFLDLRAVGTGDLMIGLESSFPSPDPQSTHIWAGSAGGVTANPNSRLIIEDDVSSYISFLNENTDGGGLIFGDPENNFAGGLTYDHGNTAFYMRVEGSNQYVFSATDLDMQNNTLLNVGAAGNDWSANSLRLQNGGSGNIELFVEQTANTDNAVAAVRILTGTGGLAADTQISHHVGGVHTWTEGLDNDQGDRWAIGAATALGSNDAMRITNATPPVISFNTAQGADFDYAEYMEKENPDEEFEKADVVGIKNGKVTHNTADAELIMVVTTEPSFAGGSAPFHLTIEEEEEYYAKMAVISFIGQVPVKVIGGAKAGDYLLPSERNDGTAIAISSDEITFEQYRKSLGIVLNKFEIAAKNLAKPSYQNILDKAENSDYELYLVAVGVK